MIQFCEVDNCFNLAEFYDQMNSGICVDCMVRRLNEDPHLTVHDFTPITIKQPADLSLIPSVEEQKILNQPINQKKQE